MTRRLVTMLAATSTMLGLAIGAAAGGAAATLPPDDTSGAALIRGQAETAAAEFFTTADPSVTSVACVPPASDSAGVEMVCYGTNGAGQVVTATATINDYGDIEMASAGTGPAPTTPTTAPSTVLASYSGDGSAARPVDPITAPTIVRVTHAGSAEFSIQPQHGGVAVGEPLLTTTGPVGGRYLVGLGGTISSFAITADGAWTLELNAASTAVPLAPGTPASGDTPDVVAYITPEPGPATVVYTGTGPIVIRAVTSDGPAVVIDEAAAFTGEVTLPAGPGHLLVDAVGSWTITLPAPVPTTAASTTAASTTAAPTTAATTGATAPGPTTAAPAATATPTTEAP
jgi:hypothetical protein